MNDTSCKGNSPCLGICYIIRAKSCMIHTFKQTEPEASDRGAARPKIWSIYLKRNKPLHQGADQKRLCVQRLNRLQK